MADPPLETWRREVLWRDDPPFHNTELMFGNYVTGSIHGFKFEDHDGDGIYDPPPGEGGDPHDGWDTPLGGIRFQLDGYAFMPGGEMEIDTLDAISGADGTILVRRPDARALSRLRGRLRRWYCSHDEHGERLDHDLQRSGIRLEGWRGPSARRQ